jgi:hypothetical protein
MDERCVACGKPIVLVNVDKARGVVGLTMGYVHRSRRANRNHTIPPEALK